MPRLDHPIKELSADCLKYLNLLKIQERILFNLLCAHYNHGPVFLPNTDIDDTLISKINLKRFFPIPQRRWVGKLLRKKLTLHFFHKVLHKFHKSAALISQKVDEKTDKMIKVQRLHLFHPEIQKNKTN